MRRFQTLATFALVLGLASSASAFSFGDLFTKSKDIDIYARTGDIDTKANAAYSLAETHVGSVMAGSKLEGDVEITVRTEDITTEANGFRSTAVTNAGVVGAVSGRYR